MYRGNLTVDDNRNYPMRRQPRHILLYIIVSDMPTLPRAQQRPCLIGAAILHKGQKQIDRSQNAARVASLRFSFFE